MINLLLVEDSPELGILYVRYLHKYEVCWAKSVKEALDAIGSRATFDIAIIDFWLGTENAIPVLVEFEGRFPEVPVVLITGGNETFSPEITRALSAVSGYSFFLMKPFARTELLSAIKTVLRLRD